MNRCVFFAFLCVSFPTNAFARSIPDCGRCFAIAKTAAGPAGIPINALSDFFLANLSSKKELDGMPVI